MQLLFGDRSPQLVDDRGRIVVDLLDGTVEVFGPQCESGLAGQHRVARGDVDLGVVEQGVFVEVGRS